MAKKTAAPASSVNLQLSIEETNTILEALGQMPFMRVYKIIEKIHLQASSGLHAGTTKTKR